MRSLLAMRASMVVSNAEERQGEADQFLTPLRGRDVVPAIVALRRQMEGVSRIELERALRKLPHASRETRAAFEGLVAGIVTKILHSPTVKLREAAGGGAGREWAEAVSQLFALSQAVVPGRAPRQTDRAEGLNGSGPIKVAAR